MNYDKLDYLLKIVLVGDSGVGKTNVLSRFTRDVFEGNSRNTIGVDFSAKDMKIKDENVKVQFWDTAGQEKYRAIANAYYKNAHGAVIIYDITNQASFDNVQNWLKELKDHGEEDIQIAIFGNKKDLEDQRVVQEEKGSQLASQYGLFFTEISAKTNEDECVNIAMEHILEQIFQIQKNKQIEENKEAISRQTQPMHIFQSSKSNKKCC